jgi:hypothetical protein
MSWKVVGNIILIVSITTRYEEYPILKGFQNKLDIQLRTRCRAQILWPKCESEKYGVGLARGFITSILSSVKVGRLVHILEGDTHTHAHTDSMVIVISLRLLHFFKKWKQAKNPSCNYCYCSRYNVGSRSSHVVLGSDLHLTQSSCWEVIATQLAKNSPPFKQPATDSTLSQAKAVLILTQSTEDTF